ncbi:hypothetical protein L3Q82_009552, partial [Scortum barcoo]
NAERMPEVDFKVDFIGKVWYPPSRGVYHLTKQKIRVVFDCGFQWFQDNKEQFSQEVMDKVLHCFYVDDCLMSVASEEEAVSLYHNLVSICVKGGFKLTLWISNRRDVLAAVPESHRGKNVKRLDMDQDLLPVERCVQTSWQTSLQTFSTWTLVQKLTTLGLSSTLCNWVLDFLTDRPQSVRIHDVSSSSISLSTGSPQGCVLSPLLFTLLTHDCSAIHPSCLIVKFADDTAVVGRIANNDESDYRQEVEHLEGWCRQNNLCINVKKTKEMIVDFRRGRHLPSPLYIGGTAVEVVSSFRYLGVHISDDLTWSKNTSCLIRKAHQRLYFLRRLRRAGLGSSVLTFLLQMCGGERPVLLHHRVAWQLLGGREEGSAEGGEGCTEDCGTAVYPPPRTSTPPDAGNGPPAS